MNNDFPFMDFRGKILSSGNNMNRSGTANITPGDWVHGSLVIKHDRYFILPYRYIGGPESKTGEAHCGGELIFGYWFAVIKQTIGQYLTVSDKLQKPMYEGDIVKLECPECPSYDSDDYEVRSSPIYGGEIHSEKLVNTLLLQDYYYSCTVIGTIHDGVDYE